MDNIPIKIRIDPSREMAALLIVCEEIVKHDMCKYAVLIRAFETESRVMAKLGRDQFRITIIK